MGNNKVGDKETFRSIVEQHSRILFGTAYLMTHDRGLAEDAVQEALVKAWKHLPSLHLNGNLKFWLVRIVINEVKQQRRKNRMTEVPLEEVPETISNTVDVEETVVSAEEHYLLRKAVAMLPPEQKEAVVLRYFTGLTVPEVAKATGQREGTIKSRLSRATDHLKEILRDQEKIGE